MPIDPNVFNNIKNFSDYQKADQAFQLQKALQTQQLQTGSIDAASKGNIYKAQMIAAAAGTGDPGLLQRAKQQVASQGIDVSDVPDDVPTAVRYANAARMAQAPAMQMLTTALAVDKNNIANAVNTGEQPKLSTPTLAAGILPAAANNPGNLRPAGASSGFQSFATPESGTNAMTSDLITKISGKSPAMTAKLGSNYQPTLSNIISTYAPSSENDTQGYINAVAQRTGFKPDQLLTINDLPKLQQAMTIQEGNAAAPAPIQAAPAMPNAIPGTTPTPAAMPKFVPPQQNPNETLPAYNNRVQQAFEAYKADPAVLASQEAAKTTATEAAKQNVEDKTGARNTQDVVGLYGKLRKDAETAPSGIAENLWASATNAAGKPNAGAIAKGTYDADLNNLYLAMIRSLKGTGRVMQSELDEIKLAQPDAKDSMEVKQAKADAHMQYYQTRMKELGFDPATGLPLNNNQIAPQTPPAATVSASQPQAGTTMQGTDGTYLFNGGDPAVQANWKKIK